MKALSATDIVRVRSPGLSDAFRSDLIHSLETAIIAKPPPERIDFARAECLEAERKSKATHNSSSEDLVASFSDDEEEEQLQTEADLNALDKDALVMLERAEKEINAEDLEALEAREKKLQTGSKALDRLVSSFIRARRAELLQAMPAKELLKIWRTQQGSKNGPMLQQLIIDAVTKEAMQAGKEGHYPLWQYKLELRRYANDEWFLRNALPVVDAALLQQALQYLEQQTELSEFWLFRQAVRMQGDDTDKLIVPTLYCYMVSLLFAPQTTPQQIAQFAAFIQQDGDLRDKAFFEPLLKQRVAPPAPPVRAGDSIPSSTTRESSDSNNLPSGQRVTPVPPPPPPIVVRVELQEIELPALEGELTACRAQQGTGAAAVVTKSFEVPAGRPGSVRAFKIVSKNRAIAQSGVVAVVRSTVDAQGKVPQDRWEVRAAVIPAALLGATRKSLCEELTRISTEQMRKYNWRKLTLQVVFDANNLAITPDLLRSLCSPPFNHSADGKVSYVQNLVNNVVQADTHSKSLADRVALHRLAMEGKNVCSRCSQSISKSDSQFVIDGDRVLHSACAKRP